MMNSISISFGFLLVFLSLSSNSACLEERRGRNSSPLLRSFSAEDLTREQQREREKEQQRAIEKMVSPLRRALSHLSLEEGQVKRRRGLRDMQESLSKRHSSGKEDF